MHIVAGLAALSVARVASVVSDAVETKYRSSCGAPGESPTSRPGSVHCCNFLQPVEGICPPPLANTSSLNSELFDQWVPIYDWFNIRGNPYVLNTAGDNQQPVPVSSSDPGRAIVRTYRCQRDEESITEDYNKYLRNVNVGSLQHAMCNCDFFGHTILIHHVALENKSMLTSGDYAECNNGICDYNEFATDREEYMSLPFGPRVNPNLHDSDPSAPEPLRPIRPIPVAWSDDANFGIYRYLTVEYVGFFNYSSVWQSIGKDRCSVCGGCSSVPKDPTPSDYVEAAKAINDMIKSRQCAPPGQDVFAPGFTGLCCDFSEPIHEGEKMICRHLPNVDLLIP